MAQTEQMTKEQFNETCGPGSVVLASKRLDPEGANVPRGAVGVVFEPANVYGDSGGPMVRWLEHFVHDSYNVGGMCNIYPGDVVVLVSVSAAVSPRNQQGEEHEQ